MNIVPLDGFWPIIIQTRGEWIAFVDGIVTFLEQQPDGDFTVDNSFVRGLSKSKKEIVSKEFASRKQSVLDMFVRKH